jgi:hypothetical protein
MINRAQDQRVQKKAYRNLNGEVVALLKLASLHWLSDAYVHLSLRNLKSLVRLSAAVMRRVKRSTRA